GHDEKDENRRLGDQLEVFPEEALVSFLLVLVHVSPGYKKDTIEENEPDIKNVPRRLDTPGQSGFTSPVNATLFGCPKTGQTTLFVYFRFAA
ncbi:MAG: hypothetical protein ACXWFO_01455, partial [Candidatus Aminicenantales bacterium]